MFDAFLRMGSRCDLITPTIASIQNIRNGPSVEFVLPADVGWSAAQIEEMLRSRGVRVWGLMVVAEEITFRVRAAQVRYAAYWLQRHGLPYAGDAELPATFRRRDGQASPRPAVSGNSALSGNRSKSYEAASERGWLLDGLLDGIAGWVDRI